jgi:hypothetical protein
MSANTQAPRGVPEAPESRGNDPQNLALESALAWARASFPVIRLHWIVQPAPSEVVARYHAGEIDKAEASAHAVCSCHGSCGSPGKHPFREGVHHATTDEATIRQWWAETPDALVGATMPPGRFAIDFDPRIEGVAATMADWRERFPPTFSQKSGDAAGGGGEHWIYSGAPDDLPGKVERGIDIIRHGHRHLVVAPALHWTGGHYGEPSGDLVDAPADMLDTIRQRKRKSAKSAAVPRTASDGYDYSKPIGDLIGVLGDSRAHDGAKYDTCFALGGVMRRNEWPAEACERLVRTWLAPSQLDAARVQHGVNGALDAYQVQDWPRNDDAIPGRKALEGAIGVDMAAAVAAIVHEHSPGIGSPRWLRRLRGLPAANDPPRPEALDPTDPLAKFCDPPDDSDEDLRYVCRSLGICVGKCTGWHGYAAAGKGPVTLSYACHAAIGRAWLGHRFEGDRPVPTLIVAFEDGPLWRRRKNRMLRAMGVDPASIPLWVRRAKISMGGDERADFIRAIGDWCVQHGVLQIILDSLTSANRGGRARQNDAEYGDLLFDLGDLSERLGLALNVLIHDNKMGAVAGTHAIEGALQTRIHVVQTSPRHASVSCERSPEESFDEMHLEIVDVPAPEGVEPPPGTDDPERWRRLWGLDLRLESEAVRASAKLSKRPQNTASAREAEQDRLLAQRRIVAYLRECDGKAEFGPSGPLDRSTSALAERAGFPVKSRAFMSARADLLDRGIITLDGYRHHLNPKPPWSGASLLRGLEEE